MALELRRNALYSHRSRQNQTSGNYEIAEIRNGAESEFKWRYQRILPEEGAAALPGTQLTVNLTDPTTHLFLQDHDGNITEYLGGYDTWNSMCDY